MPIFVVAATDNPTTAEKPTKHNTTSKAEENLFWKFSVSSWYFFGLVGLFVVTALCHPTEAGCLVHGIWYLLCLPSGYLFLITYSVCNLTDRSWGKLCCEQFVVFCCMQSVLCRAVSCAGCAVQCRVVIVDMEGTRLSFQISHTPDLTA